MYGKHFESMYTGSMFGKPFSMYAVWGYVISHQRQSRKDGKFYVELNPEFMSALFASTAKEVISVIQCFCEKDLKSRSQEQDGRKLVPTFEGTLHGGPMEFWVVNGKKYKEIRDEEDRREYNRVAKRKQRQQQSSSNVNHVIDMSEKSTMSADPDPDPDPEADTEEEADKRRGDARGDRDIELPTPGVDQLSGPDLVDGILPGIGYVKPRPARRARNKAPAVELTDAWKPSDALLKAKCQKFECDPKVILAHLPDFLFYWMHGEGAGSLKRPCDWEKTFSNRIDQLAGYGRLHIPNAQKGPNKHGPPQPNDTDPNGWFETTVGKSQKQV